MACEKCSKLCSVLLIVFGVLFLLQDLNVWDFWAISWYTVGFILLGLGFWGCSKCPMCLEMKGMPEKKRK